MNLFKKSFVGIFIFLFILGLIYTPADKARAEVALGVPVTVLMTANGSSSDINVLAGTTVRIDWEATGDVGLTCVNNFDSQTGTSGVFYYPANAQKQFTVTCTNAPCVPGKVIRTGSGTWTAPTDIENCKVVVAAIGGGGGGRGGYGINTDNSCKDNAKMGGDGGGAGGVAMRFYNTSSSAGKRIVPGDVIAYSVGTGGVKGLGGSGDVCTPTAGADGTQTYFRLNGSIEAIAYPGRYTSSIPLVGQNGGGYYQPGINAENFVGFNGDSTPLVISSRSGATGADNIRGIYSTINYYMGSDVMGLGGAGGAGGGWKLSGADASVSTAYGAGGGGGGSAGDIGTCITNCKHDGGDGSSGTNGAVVIEWYDPSI